LLSVSVSLLLTASLPHTLCVGYLLSSVPWAWLAAPGSWRLGGPFYCPLTVRINRSPGLHCPAGSLLPSQNPVPATLTRDRGGDTDLEMHNPYDIPWVSFTPAAPTDCSGCSWSLNSKPGPCGTGNCQSE
jgi:hypothetical protein